MKQGFFFLFFVLLVSEAVAISFDAVPQPTGFVNDFAGVLSIEEKTQLESLVQQVNQSTTVEIAVVLIDSTEIMPIEEFAWRLGNQWGVGKQDVKNGVLVLVAVNDHRFFVATAQGMEGTLPDILVKRIAEKNFPLNFRENRFFEGLQGFVLEVKAVAENDPTILSRYSESFEPDSPWWSWVFLLSFWFFWAIPFWLVNWFGQKLSSPWLGLLLFEALLIGGFFVFLPNWLIFGIFVGGFVGFLVALQIVSGSLRGLSGGRSWGGGWSGGHSSGGHSFGGGGGFSGGGAGGRW